MQEWRELEVVEMVELDCVVIKGRERGQESESVVYPLSVGTGTSMSR